MTGNTRHSGPPMFSLHFCRTCERTASLHFAEGCDLLGLEFGVYFLEDLARGRCVVSHCRPIASRSSAASASRFSGVSTLVSTRCVCSLL